MKTALMKIVNLSSTSRLSMFNPFIKQDETPVEQHLSADASSVLKRSYANSIDYSGIIETSKTLLGAQIAVCMEYSVEANRMVSILIASGTSNECRMDFLMEKLQLWHDIDKCNALSRMVKYYSSKQKELYESLLV